MRLGRPTIRLVPLLTLMLCAAPACGEGNNVAPPEAGEGAVGAVAVDDAGAAEPPLTPTGQAGGPAGQTPVYGEPGGAPTEVRRQPDDGVLAQ